ncbi:L,D-transpeptidase [Bordetella bronchialis]|uniref:YkuD domain-containing protein n=1 Tax=Bordetella bronchialis TaxID=463025 RepID=A0A193FYU2_9BORD|nr:L,D-transpeptidase [Bordetella bronchialis]ANN72159.1 hypothetical protein BAU08_13165 [Bordetella bronchialis]
MKTPPLTAARTRIARLAVQAGWILAALAAVPAVPASPAPDDVAAAYRKSVRPQLYPPEDEAQYYGVHALLMLEQAGADLSAPQYVAVVDRDPRVQAIFLYWLLPAGTARLVGASPVSTGRVGEFDHFETPIGVFEHSVSDGDFRAEGTKNENGIRGYGRKGMRIYDFGWQQAVRGWGAGGFGTMRLQVHATDPDLLEPRLGRVHSKGCVRIPSSLNVLLDQFGLIDADYEAAEQAGQHRWVLSPRRTPAQGAGRYLVILDSERPARPAWLPAPR